MSLCVQSIIYEEIEIANTATIYFLARLLR